MCDDPVTKPCPQGPKIKKKPGPIIREEEASTRFLNRAEVVSFRPFHRSVVSRLPSPSKIRKKILEIKKKNPSKMDSHPFYGGVPKKHVRFFKKKIVVPASQKKILFCNAKIREKKFVKISIFELPDPKIGGGGEVTSVRAEIQLLPPPRAIGGRKEGGQPKGYSPG